MSFIITNPIEEALKDIPANIKEELCLYFRDLHSKEILENFPLPSLPDDERIQLDEFLRAGTYDYK